MDAPLLGARNRVILAGIMSPFRSKAGVFAIQQPSASEVSLNPSQSIGTPPVRQARSFKPSSLTDKIYSQAGYRQDPLFNPPYPNDVLIQNRSWRENVEHFARKHRDEGFIPASFNHWVDHFEFGSCLLNSKRLKEQYRALRELDDTAPDATKVTHAVRQDRVRFVQFYTASYKGRAGKRWIERNYLNGGERPKTGGQSISFDEKNTMHNAEELPVNDDIDEHAAGLEELHFCKLARQKNGEVDPLWKKITMATNDEINAHTILFMPGPHYEDLVEKTCHEIMDWVMDDNS